MINAYPSKPFSPASLDERTLDAVLDREWIGALSRLGRLVMALHRLTSDDDDLQHRAFDAMRAELPFDSGIWITGVTNPGLRLHSAYAYHLPPEATVAWRELADDNVLLQATIANPGRVFRATADEVEGGRRFPPGIRVHAHRLGMEQILATSFVAPTSGLFDGFCLFRTDPRARFSEPERLLVQHALPHLVETWWRWRRTEAPSVSTV